MVTGRCAVRLRKPAPVKGKQGRCTVLRSTRLPRLKGDQSRSRVNKLALARHSIRRSVIPLTRQRTRPPRPRDGSLGSPSRTRACDTTSSPTRGQPGPWPVGPHYCPRFQAVQGWAPITSEPLATEMALLATTPSTAGYMAENE